MKSRCPASVLFFKSIARLPTERCVTPDFVRRFPAFVLSAGFKGAGESGDAKFCAGSTGG
jgi:hypothetical protein